MFISATKSLADSTLIEENSLQETYDKIRVLEPLITDDLSQLVEKMGTKLEGLEYAVKTASSVENKISRSILKDSELDKSHILQTLKDVIRYTEICDHSDIINVTKKTIQNMEEKGYILSELKNYYADPYPDTEYMGVHLNFISPYGQEFELQVHSPESFDVKQKGHELYEKIRVCTLQQEKETFKKEIVNIHQSIPKAPNYEELKDYKIPNKQAIITERKNKCQVDYERRSVDNGDGYCLVYKVKHHGKTEISGFENRYSDGSLDIYRDLREKTPTVYELSPNGQIISTHIVNSLDLNIEDVLRLSVDKEAIHQAWMKENYHEKMVEDIEFSNQSIISDTTIDIIEPITR